MTFRLLPVARRAGWGLGDQALSSLTNFAVAILVARFLGPQGFGAYSIAFAVYVLAMSLARAIASEPLVVRYSTASSQTWREGTQRATGTSATLGLGIGLACVGAGSLLRGDVGGALLALGACMPGLLVQDCWRFAFVARGGPRSAFVNDGLWALALVPAFGVLALSGRLSAAGAVLGWGAAGTFAAIAGGVQAGLVPRPLKIIDWWRQHRDLVPRFAGEFMTLTAAAQGSLFGIGLVAGVSAVGAFRAAWVLFGPIQVLLLATPLVAVPEAARALRAGMTPTRIAMLVGSGLTLVSAAVGVLLLTLPESAGTWLLADTWPSVQPLLLPVTAAVMGSSLVTGPYVALRALAAARQSLRARLLVQPLVLCAEVAGAALAGAVGAAWGGATAVWAGVPVWWRQLRAGQEASTEPA